MGAKLPLCILTIAILSGAFLYSPAPHARAVVWPALPSLPELARRINASSDEHLFEGDLVGPESFAQDSPTSFYTGLLDGRVIRVVTAETHNVSEVQYETVAQLKRPLGMRYVAELETLYICDSYVGVYGYHVPSATLTLLYSSPDLHFVNSLAVSIRRNKLYFTDASRFPVHQFMYDVLEQSLNGTLYEIDLASKQTRKLLEGLPMANGIVLTAGEDHVIIALTTQASLIKIDLDSLKVDFDFVTNLPGYPDNLSVDRETGHIVVGLPSPRLAPFELGHFLQGAPWLRRLVAGLIPLPLLQVLVRPYGMILFVSEQGQTVDAIVDPTGHVRFATEALLVGSYMYYGSFRNPYLGRFHYTLPSVI